MSAIAPRVLIVDDEPQLVRGLKIMLRTAGYVVETARTALEMLAILAAHPPDVVVLDFVLPDGQGVEVCKQVRRRSKLPILIMSAIGAEREKVRALDAGADDYLAKPFRGEELLARLRRVLQRSVAGGGSSTLEIGELIIDLARRRVTRAGAVVLLAPTEFEIVRVLAQHPGRLVTDGQLLRTAWGPEHLEQTRHLRVRVAQIRTKLERDPSHPKYLITEPGIGYRFRDPQEAVA
jgi:two-component system, OmpR family, KDP operon response regulator KdpE